MSNEALIQQLTTHSNQVVKLKELIDSQIVRQVRFTTAERSGASMMLVGCDYLIENLSALRAAIALK